MARSGVSNLSDAVIITSPHDTNEKCPHMSNFVKTITNNTKNPHIEVSFKTATNSTKLHLKTILRTTYK